MKGEPKKIKPVVLKDLFTMDPKHPLYVMNVMCTIPIYQLRIRKKLYKAGQLSAEGFLNNDNILNIPNVAKRNYKGEILINDILQAETARYSLAQKIHTSGNEYLAFLIKFDDALYESILASPEDVEDIFEQEEVKNSVFAADKIIEDKLVDIESVIIIEENSPLSAALTLIEGLAEAREQ